jgi:Leucine-rich repeat (LRR) protein
VSKFMMWKVFSVVMALVLVLQLSGVAMLPVPVAAADPVVTFPDANLEAAIRVAISKPTGDIYASELAMLWALNANGRSIGNLGGLEYCTGLRWLLLRNNRVSDLSALSGLTNLEGLDLTNNQVSGFSALAGLIRMIVLDLSDNQISDVAPVAAMDNLTNLGLPNNLVNNLAPLAGKANLVFLNLTNNRVSDISPLAGLTRLNTIDCFDRPLDRWQQDKQPDAAGRIN